MGDQPTGFSERTSLSDTRTAMSSLVLALLVLLRALTSPFRPLPYLLLALAIFGALLALWEARSRYVWREDPDHRVPRPWTAFTAAISIICSCLAGLLLTFQDLPDILVNLDSLTLPG